MKMKGTAMGIEAGHPSDHWKTEVMDGIELALQGLSFEEVFWDDNWLEESERKEKAEIGEESAWVKNLSAEWNPSEPVEQLKVREPDYNRFDPEEEWTDLIRQMAQDFNLEAEL